MPKPLPPSMAVRKARKDLGMTQEALSEKASISVQYLRAIEAGYGSISDDVKKRLADALNYSVWALFPDVKREVDLFNVIVARHDLELNPKETPMFKEVLSRMNEDEFEELISSGTTPQDVSRAIRAFAESHNIEVVK